jgi:mannose-P-dolichol utilization defect protein 1
LDTTWKEKASSCPCGRRLEHPLFKAPCSQSRRTSASGDANVLRSNANARCLSGAYALFTIFVLISTRVETLLLKGNLFPSTDAYKRSTDLLCRAAERAVCVMAFMAFGLSSWQRATDATRGAAAVCSSDAREQHSAKFVVTSGTQSLKSGPKLLGSAGTHGRPPLIAGLAAAAPLVPPYHHHQQQQQQQVVRRALPLGLLSQVLGWLVIIGSSLYKVPQVVRILRVRSAKGISVTTYVCETVSTACSFCYALRQRFPFDTFGESGFILIQNVMILVLMSHFDARPRRWATLAILGSITLLMGVLLSPRLAPPVVVTVAQAVSIPLLNLSRIPQIVMNAQLRTTGELSITTMLLQLLGNAARLFTTLVRLDGNLPYLLSAIVALALNSILVYQYFRFYAE